jgi:hypothetical protein
MENENKNCSGLTTESPRPAQESCVQRDWAEATVTYAYQKLQMEQYALMRHVEVLERVSAEACFGHPELGRARTQLESVEFALHILDCFPRNGVNAPARDAETTA